ncbi:MAG: chorismate mutase [Minisyncoccia bacterium]|jgi:chorismate mutase
MKVEKENELKKLRKEIDKIDKKIVKLLEERLKIAEKIMKLKVKKGLNLTDKKREREIIENLTKQTNDLLLKKYLSQIYRIIFKISKEKHKKFIKI